MKPKYTKRGALFGTAIFLGCLATPALAIDIAGNLLIDLDAADFNQATGIWNQHSATPNSIQGPFTKVANATPQKMTIGGATAVVLDGDSDYLIGPNTNAALDANKAPYSVEYWVFQGYAEDEEAVLSWSSRGNDGQNAAFNYGSNPSYGAVGHWGGANDMGFPTAPPAGSWHLISYTYDGTTQVLYLDGVFSSSKVSNLDAKDGLPLVIGATREPGGTTTNTGLQYSGAVGKMRIHSGVLTAAQITNNYNAEIIGYPGITAENLTRGPVQRYSFSNPVGSAPEGSVIVDSVSGLNAKIVGTGATFMGTKVQLPGGGSGANPAYVDLPNGILSSKQRLTIEVWSTQTSNQTWSRLMTFGTTTLGEVFTAGNSPAFTGGSGLEIFSNEGGAGNYRIERRGGVISNGAAARSSVGGTVLGTQLHQAVIFDPDRQEWRLYRNGYLMESLPESQGPTTLPDVNNWLGRSEYGGDNGFNGTFDEFRVYNYVLTEGQLRGNIAAGPDVLTAPASAAAGWVPTTGGSFSFNNSANWSPAVVPNGPGTIAALTSDLVGDEMVSLDAAISVGGLSIGDFDGSNKFTVAAGTGGSLTLDAGAGMTASLTQRGSSSGATISAPILLGSNTEISVLGGNSLTLSGTLGGAGNVFATGPGTIAFTGDASGYAGTMTINGGAVNVGNGGNTGTLPTNVVINSPGQLVLNRSDAFNLSQTITGIGANSYVRQNGPGEVTVTGTINSTGYLAIKSGTSLINNSSVTVQYLNVNGMLTMNQGAAQLTVTNDFNLGDLEAGPSSVMMSAGKITAPRIYLGKNAGTAGVLVQTGGDVVVTGGDTRIGGTSSAAANAFGAWRILPTATVTTSGNIQIGAGGTGIMEVAGGTVNFSNGGFPVIGRYQSGTTESYGLLDLSSGIVNQNVTGARLIVGEEGFGTLNVRGMGTLTCLGGIWIGHSGAGGLGDGTVNLSGSGVIETVLVDQNQTGANGNFNFHGGTLRARVDSAAWFQNIDIATIWLEGLFIDTNGKTVTSSQNFSDPVGDGVTGIPVDTAGSGYLAAPFIEITGGGGFGATAVANLAVDGSIASITVTNPGQNYTSAPTIVIHGGVAGTGLVVGTPTTGANVKGNFNKTGSGTLKLTSSQFYTGNTIVADGTLVVNSSLLSSANVTVSSTGTLGGTGDFPTVTVNGTLQPGDATGTMTVDNLTFGAGANLSINIDDSKPATNGKVNVNGAIILNNVNLKVSVVGAATLAPYEILTTFGDITGDFASVSPGVQYVIDRTSSPRTVTITAAGSPYDTFIGGYFPGVTDPLVIGQDADPDGDGSSNLVEFALGGIPNQAGSGPKVFTQVADSSDVGTETELLMTVAVLQGAPAFTGTPSPVAAYKGVNYQVQGSLDLVDFTSPVTQVDPIAPAAPNDTPPAGYEYRTFRLDASNGLPNKGFLRMQVK